MARRKQDSRVETIEISQKDIITEEKEMDFHVEPTGKGYVSDTVKAYFSLSRMPKVDIFDPKAVEDRCIAYFRFAMDNAKKPTIEGMALALHLQRRTLMFIAEGTEPMWYISKVLGGRTVPQASRDVLIWAISLINATLVDDMVNSRIQPVAGMFIMKNNFGYTDVSKVEVAPVIEEKRPTAELIAEAKALESQKGK